MIGLSASIMLNLGDNVMNELTSIPKQKTLHCLIYSAIIGLLIGFVVGSAGGIAFLGMVLGAFVFALISFAAVSLAPSVKIGRFSIILLFFILGMAILGLTGAIIGLLFAWPFSWFVFWIHMGKYREHLLPYQTQLSYPPS